MTGSLKLFVTGAAGTIGRRLVQHLLHAGHQVHALVLPEDVLGEQLEGAGCTIWRGDLTRPETLVGALEGVHTVYHLAAVLLVEDPRLFRQVNVDGTRHLLCVARAAGVEHFIHISSASVVYPRSTHYSRSKREGEDLVRYQRGLHTTIIRPTLVYEKGGGLEFATFERFLLSFPLIVPFLGQGTALKNPVHADDLVAALATLAGNPLTYGRQYDLCGGEALSLRELAELILRLHGRHKLLLPLPLSLCRVLAQILGTVRRRTLFVEHTLAGLTQSADLDCSAARRDLGYYPRSVREGLFREGEDLFRR
jgi:nucleoside-diphosphate-sugar epimerase